MPKYPDTLTLPGNQDSSKSSTYVFLVGLALTWASLQGDTPTQVARYAAIGSGLSLAAMLLLEFRHGLYALLRTDLVAILAAYVLTLLEFLFEQPQFDHMVSVGSVRIGVQACLMGYVGLAVPRLLNIPFPTGIRMKMTQQTKASSVTTLFWICFAVGITPMLIGVGYQVGELIYYWGAPRFSQPWGRGRLGNLSALLFELSMLLYLVPPIAGVILARKERYSMGNKVGVTIAMIVTLFQGFAGGTRNLFAAYLLTFLAAYLFAQPAARQRGSWIKNTGPTVFAVGVLALLGVSIKLMLSFRSAGLWAYLATGGGGEEYLNAELFVDYNLWVISLITGAFPDHHAFLGMEVPYLALIRIVPRAFWPGKPEGLSVPIEDVVGVEGMTLAASFVGEAYISGGFLAVFITGFVFGTIARWWNNLAGPDLSDLGVLAYASGFFAVAISMRSMLVFTTAALPTLAAVVYCIIVARTVRPPRYVITPYKTY